MSANSPQPKFSSRAQAFLGWLRQSSERFAIAIVIAITVGLCLLLVLLPQKKMAAGGHEHGQGHEEGEGEEHELAVELDDDVLESAGMLLEEAKPIQIVPRVISRGQIIENANRSMNVKPRFSGIVRTVHKDFGDQVRKGDTLMVIESATTRSSYSIRTAIDGVVADKRVVAGSFVPENESVFRVVNLATVWFQGRVPVREAAKIKSGFSAGVKDRLLNVSGKGSVHYVSPIVEEDTQACDVRIELENKEGDWRVGSFAEAEILLEPIDVKIAVKSTAIQNLNGQSVVFIRDEDHIIATPVSVGWSDETWSEVLTGIKAGDTYVSTNSFLAKAELLKSTAEHEH